MQSIVRHQRENILEIEKRNSQERIFQLSQNFNQNCKPNVLLHRAEQRIHIFVERKKTINRHCYLLTLLIEYLASVDMRVHMGLEYIFDNLRLNFEEKIQ